jgi:hypothetical protein
MTAFVGPSGAGKTTVFSMIERFYEPGSGRVLLDGKNITEWPLAQLRAAIGYVEQDAPVLSGTLRENILIAHPRPARPRSRKSWPPPGSPAWWPGCPQVSGKSEDFDALVRLAAGERLPWPIVSLAGGSSRAARRTCLRMNSEND